MNTKNAKQKQGSKRPGTRIADRMYEFLVSIETSVWWDRQALAEKMGKAHLNTSEKSALVLLAKTGRIEQRVIDVTPFLKRLEYRVQVGGQPIHNKEPQSGE